MELTAILQKDELVERCRRGDRLACRDLYERYARAMYNTCLRMLNNVGEAEDLLQESFTEAFKNLDRFEYRTSFGGWLKQICINRCINQLKKRKGNWVELADMDQPDRTASDTIDEEWITMRVDTVKRAMSELPDGYRTVLNLYLFEGYDHEEIAGIMNVAESTTRTQFSRGKQKLLQLLNRDYEQAGKVY